MFTEKEFVQAVRDKVKSAPNNIYFGIDPPANASITTIRCFYSKGKCEDGSVGCIFGQVLLQHHTKEQLEEIESNDTTDIYYALEHLGYEFSDNTMIWASEIQSRQDDGDTWDKALAYADNIIYRRTTNV